MSMSRQEQRAAEAQQMAHARQAAREITHERTESARVVGGGDAGPGHEEAAQPELEVHRSGILETVQQGARSLVSAVSRTLAVASRDDATAESPVADNAAPAAKGMESAAENAKDTARSDGTAATSPEEYKRSAVAVV